MPRPPKPLADTNTLGAHLRAALKRRGKTQKELADHLGTDPSHVSKWCHNKTHPASRYLQETADYLNVPVDDLIYGTETIRENEKNIVNGSLQILSECLDRIEKRLPKNVSDITLAREQLTRIKKVL